MPADGAHFHPEIELTPASAERWGSEPTLGRHNLAGCQLFDDAAIIELLGLVPKENLFALHMGDDPELNAENRLALHDGLPPAELLRAVRTGRLWLNVTRIDVLQHPLNDLVGQLYEQLARKLSGFQPRVTTVTLLVSSPRALVYYHADGPASLLWHVRGDKKLWVYPREPRFVAKEALEDIFAGAAHEYLPYENGFDRAATAFDLSPGTLATWPANSPHRVTNGDSFCVSLSTEHFTPDHRRKARVYQANRLLRVALGLRNTSVRSNGLGSLAKQAAYVVASRTGLGVHPSAKRHTPALRVDPDAPGGVRPL